MKRAFLAGLLVMAAGCQPSVTIKQDKPLDINVNIKGQLDLNLVIHDARQNLEEITGEKPTQVVRPEDIGLPAVPAKSGAMAPVSDETMADEGAVYPVMLSTRRGQDGIGETRYFQIAAADDLKKAMAARDKEIRALWDSKAVGESHTGLLVAKGTLTAAQQKVVAAENADRAALYAAEAKEKKTTPDEVAVGYYVARLGYAKAGAWYDKLNPATKQWEWKQWGQ